MAGDIDNIVIIISLNIFLISIFFLYIGKYTKKSIDGIVFHKL